MDGLQIIELMGFRLPRSRIRISTEFSVLQEFCRTLALLSRGSLTQKLDWIFSLYDVNRDGAVCLADLEEITASVTVIIIL